MKATIVPIGNSRGIRIPKLILEQCHMDHEVLVEVEDDTIILRPIKHKPRKNWEKSFMRMKKNQDDQLMIDDAVGLEMEDWEW